VGLVGEWVERYVQVVPEDAEGEDGHGEAIAAEAWVTAGELGEYFIVVFCERFG